MIGIAIVGYGVVGSGVYEVVKQKKGIEVKALLDIKDFPHHEEKHLFVDSFDKILANKDIKIVVESIGGLNPAYDYSKKALEAGKYVITSNKELVAAHGKELIGLAHAKGVKYFYEASVGGGIPIIRPLNQCLSGEDVSEICGIFNGTTNYILTEMGKGGKTFENALADAQAKGYAELDPTDDIEGFDTRRKVKILTQLVFGQDIPLKDIPATGITKISLEDIRKAEADGCALKLIGYAKKLECGRIECAVKPTAVPKSSPLYGVEGVFNGIMVKSHPVGEVMFYGRGAGKFPTASAVLADILEAAGAVS